MYADLAAAPDDKSRSASMAHDAPVVFVVDDDASARESLELLIRGGQARPRSPEANEQQHGGARLRRFLVPHN
jgi:hypothetical protein